MTIRVGLSTIFELSSSSLSEIDSTIFVLPFSDSESETPEGELVEQAETTIKKANVKIVERITQVCRQSWE